MKWYYYDIYRKIVRSNVEIPMLSETSDNCSHDIMLIVEFQDSLIGNGIYVKRSNEKYIVSLGEFAQYTIDNNNNYILCLAKNRESLISTLFNIPFSVYFARNCEILFHACTVLHEKELICFTGNKGIGKSTVSALMNAQLLSYYSDDTILLTSKINAYRAHNLAKFTEETALFLDIDYKTAPKNLANKCYIYLQTKEEPFAIVSDIIQLHRGNKLEIHEVKTDILKKQVFVNNIVGIKYFDKELLQCIYNTYDKGIYKKIRIFKLIIPEDLKHLVDVKNDLYRLIMDKCSSRNVNGTSQHSN